MTADAAGGPVVEGHRHGASLLRLGLATAAVAGLVVDAVVHLELAPGYQLASPGGIGEGTLFRIEAALAIVTALGLLLRPARGTFAAAFVVAAGGLGAVLLYRYVDVPALGPVPSMYEPVWYAEKTVSALAEAITAGLASAGALLAPQTRPTPKAMSTSR